MGNSKFKLTAKEIALIGMMIAVLEVSKIALMGLPNIELVTFWIIMFTLYFGKRIWFALPVFILLEGALFGFGIWWIMYLYIWPLLVLIAWLFRKIESSLTWAIISGFYGLLYGFFCSFPYFVIGTSSGGLKSGLYAGITWWIAGIPFDLIHGIANFFIMLILYRPIKAVMSKTKTIFKGI